MPQEANFSLIVRFGNGPLVARLAVAGAGFGPGVRP